MRDQKGFGEVEGEDFELSLPEKGGLGETCVELLKTLMKSISQSLL